LIAAFAVNARRERHVRIELVAGNDAHAVVFPAFGFVAESDCMFARVDVGKELCSLKFSQLASAAQLERRRYLRR
jgi:hypothetical protein